MSTHFDFAPTPSGTEFRLVSNAGNLPTNLWATAPRALLPGVDLLNRLVAEERALSDDDFVLLDHAAVADLSASEAASLNLPPLADAIARVETDGLIVRPEFRAVLQWRRVTGQSLVGGEFHRLSSALFAIAEAVDAVASAGDETASRLIAIGRLREVLPLAEQQGDAIAGGLLPAIEVIQADAFSLDLVGEGSAARLVPILHLAGSTDPLLPPELQEAFGDRQFNQFSEVRPVYTLPGHRYVVLAPVLRRALGEVRRRQASTVAAKRALMAAPRAVLRAALETADDPTLADGIEEVFVDTPAFSDRVIGLGLWTPRVIPWIARHGIDWFGPDLPGGLIVGDRRVVLTPEEAEKLAAAIDSAMARGEPTVVWNPPEGPAVTVPANPDTRQALSELAHSRKVAPDSTPRDEKPEPKPVESLLILTNEGEIEHQRDFAPRPGPSPGLPACLHSTPKQHQRLGVQWLQQCWLSGRPGVLLADDMGLGKTLQGLAFLAWLREGMDNGTIERAPLLIVAPTGLLANWLAEHQTHLSGMGLGDCLAAYGAGLRTLRTVDADGVPSLDRSRLRAADWVLTTYETLRDYDRDFGAVRFAVLLADEAQKVKTPGARITDAFKGMNADFRIAMTGTPVENRLADLWCIVDGVHSGWLGDLKAFSARYEAQTDLDRLAELKGLMENPFGGAPALLMRRLKEDQLPDLPQAVPHVETVAFPPIQLQAYDAVLAEVRGEKRKGAVLEALQKLRAVSLHPDPMMLSDDAEFISASARLSQCIVALESIHAAGERALVLLDSLDMQARLAGLIQRRYGLAAPPAIISGEVAGHRRQQRVDRFQAASEGFDVMILSPRAGGVGLTLTQANHVLHLARWWNPAVEDQCNGRALRIGQTRAVHVHIPIGTLPDGRRSFDENLHALLERKRDLMRRALLPGGLSERDQQELLDETLAG